MINKKRKKVVDYILHHGGFVEVHNEYMRLWKDKQPKDWIIEQTIGSIHSGIWCDAIWYAGYRSISIDDVQDFKPNFLKVMDSVENEIKKYLLTI